ncbi:hypothetical protein B0H63DRAFT_192961 [Podospora didyma]|uniref:LITAF domain-containing protein n=1 Tax=Podospora didyma TaxID=330526 RepID=A0AAE0TV11_9PEZI|nr:hypothetical protein B0H63DRAFT_192961 [Podospora didyma]
MQRPQELHDMNSAAPPDYTPQVPSKENPSVPAKEQSAGANNQQPHTQQPYTQQPYTQQPQQVYNQQPQQTGPATAQQGQVAAVTPMHLLSDHPQWIDCPFCHHRAQTRVEKVGTPMQAVAGVLCCLLCVCLACVPCMAGWFEETHYFCTACKQKIAVRSDNGVLQQLGPQVLVPSQYPIAKAPGPGPQPASTPVVTQPAPAHQAQA